MLFRSVVQIIDGDFNGDGKIDIAVNDLNDYSVALLLGNGDGTFVSCASRTDDFPRGFGRATWGYPAFMAAGDLNGDGKPEIVVTNLFEAAVTVLQNTTIVPVATPTPTPTVTPTPSSTPTPTPRPHGKPSPSPTSTPTPTPTPKPHPTHPPHG